MTDLDRYSELISAHGYHDLSGTCEVCQEIESLKAKIEGQINGKCEAHHEELESQVAKLKEEYGQEIIAKLKLEKQLEYTSDKLGNELQVAYLKIEQLESILDEIKELNELSEEITGYVSCGKLKKILAKHEDNHE